MKYSCRSRYKRPRRRYFYQNIKTRFFPFILFAKANGGTAGARPHDLKNLPIRGGVLAGRQTVQERRSLPTPPAEPGNAALLLR